MWRRRALTIPGLVIIAVTVSAAAPLLLLVSLILSPFKSLRSLPQATLFAIGFVFYECVGLTRLTWAWVRYRNTDRWIDQNYLVQRWWAQSLLDMSIRLFKLTFEVSGQEAIAGPSAILICRHASMADNVLPLLCFGKARDEPLRYILKKELTILPCLDVCAHRLPCLFVDRSGTDTDSAVNAVADLVATAGPDESIMVYPEGTRFSPEKQRKLAEKPQLVEQVKRWPNLLPPRLGGVTAMLEVNPGKDVAFLCHTGFEGSASISDIVNGGWLNQHIRIHFWRVPNAEIPADKAKFVFQQWDVMQAQVERLTNG